MPQCACRTQRICFSRLMIPVEEIARIELCLLLLLMQMRCGCILAGREPRAQRVNVMCPSLVKSSAHSSFRSHLPME